MGYIKDTKAAISLRIEECYGDTYKVYTEDIKQGLKSPCFRIALLKPSSSQMPMGRKRKTRPYVVTYFPENNSLGEMDDMGETLEESLSLIALPDGSKLRGTDISYEIKGGILHFFVNYNYDTITREEHEPMEKLVLKGIEL